MGHFQTVSTGIAVLSPIISLLPETVIAQPIVSTETDLSARSAITPALDSATHAQTVIATQGQHTRIEGGVQVNNNLFHRFELFNVETGATAEFVTAPVTNSVIGQVSGLEASYINGTLQVFGSEADLYLINPNGYCLALTHS
ncbi:MAG: filamentous hemagglutinin N-terminal domain-containing protein [Cyanobacteria bacterium P01_D01_bin.1]